MTLISDTPNDFISDPLVIWIDKSEEKCFNYNKYIVTPASPSKFSLFSFPQTNSPENFFLTTSS